MIDASTVYKHKSCKVLKVTVSEETGVKRGEANLDPSVRGDASREGRSARSVVLRPHLLTTAEIKAPVVPRATDAGGFPITNVFNIP